MDLIVGRPSHRASRRGLGGEEVTPHAEAEGENEGQGPTEAEEVDVGDAAAGRQRDPAVGAGRWPCGSSGNEGLPHAPGLSVRERDTRHAIDCMYG